MLLPFVLFFAENVALRIDLVDSPSARDVVKGNHPIPTRPTRIRCSRMCSVFRMVSSCLGVHRLDLLNKGLLRSESIAQRPTDLYS